jgi:hypothetical protein
MKPRGLVNGRAVQGNTVAHQKGRCLGYQTWGPKGVQQKTNQLNNTKGHEMKTRANANVKTKRAMAMINPDSE